MFAPKLERPASVRCSSVYVPRRAYLLIGWPRTGSSVLAEALTATEVLGSVHEYFWRLVEPMHAAAFGMPTPTDETYEPYLEAALRHGTSSNGVFGAKLFWAHAVDLVRRTGLMLGFADREPIERLWAPFGDDVRIVFTRRNCLRSALSLWRAEITQEWGRRPGEAAVEPPATLDVWRVSELHADIHMAEIGWESIVRASGRPLLEITYDDISRDLTDAVTSVACFVDIRLAADFKAVPSYLQQADHTTDRFEAEWRTATGGCRACHTSALQA